MKEVNPHNKEYLETYLKDLFVFKDHVNIQSHRATGLDGF